MFASFAGRPKGRMTGGKHQPPDKKEIAGGKKKKTNPPKHQPDDVANQAENLVLHLCKRGGRAVAPAAPDRVRVLAREAALAARGGGAAGRQRFIKANINGKRIWRARGDR